MDDLVKQVTGWFEEKGFDNPTMQFAKMTEESGEIAHELTRNHLNTAEMKDALGDTMVTLIGLCYILGYTPEECLQAAWDEIKDRKGKMVNGSFVKNV